MICVTCDACLFIDPNSKVGPAIHISRRNVSVAPQMLQVTAISSGQVDSIDALGEGKWFIVYFYRYEAPLTMSGGAAISWESKL